MLNVVSEMINLVKRMGAEVVFNRYYGIYPAKVMDNKDPAGMGRVRVKSFVFGHDREVKTWVAPLWSDMMYDPPEVGSNLWIQFISGSLNRPVYVGTRKIVDDPRFSEFQQKDEEPTIRGFKTKHGHVIMFNDTSGEEKIEIKTPGGQKMVLDESNDLIRLEVGGNIELDGGDIELNISGKALIKSNEAEIEANDVTLNGTNVTITGGICKMDGVAPPTGSGPFCAIPACLFTGAPHVGDTVTGT